MKQCPQCGRVYDNTMMFCLDDGAELLYGPRSQTGAATRFAADESQTAILHDTSGQNEAPTRGLMYTTEQTAVLASGIDREPKSKRFDKRLLFAPVALAVVALVFLGY